MTIEPDARDLLVSLLGADRLASRSEIAKLLLYRPRVRKAITADHVVEAVADASVQANDDALDAAFGGDMAGLDAAMAKLHLGPVEAGLLLGAALRHAVALHRAKLSGPGEDSPFRFGLPPKRKAAIDRQLALLRPRRAGPHDRAARRRRSRWCGASRGSRSTTPRGRCGLWRFRHAPAPGRG